MKRITRGMSKHFAEGRQMLAQGMFIDDALYVACTQAPFASAQRLMGER